jgi:MFS family permease
MTTEAGTAIPLEPLAPEIELPEPATKGKTVDEARVRLWRDGNFNLFWASQTFDTLGDAASLIIIPLLVLNATGSVAQMGFVTATTGITSMIATFFSGILTDRLNRRKLMINCDIARTVCYLLIPLSWWFWGPKIWIIYVVAIIAAYLTANFIVAYHTIVPNIVAQNQIHEANGHLQTTAALAYIAGPIIAGFASSLLSPTMAVTVVAASYLASAILMLLVRVRKNSANPSKESEETKASPFQEFMAGIRFLLNHRVLRAVTMLLIVFFFASGATVNLAMFRLKNDLHQSDRVIGTIFGIASCGSIFGGILAAALRRRWGFGPSFLGSLILQGIAIICIGLAPSVAVMTVLATLFTFGLTIRYISTMSLRQEVTPDHLLGRVTSALLTLVLVLTPIGIALATLLAEKLGTRPVLIFSGAICVGGAIIGIFTSAQTRQPVSDDMLS